MIQPIPYFSEATYMCLFPIIIFFVMAIYKLTNGAPLNLQCISISFYASDAPEHKLPATYKIFSGSLALLYIAMTSFTEVLQGSAFERIYTQPFGYILKLLLIILSFFCCYFILYQLFSNCSERDRTSFAKLPHTPIYIVIVPIFLFTIFFVIGSYPGFMSSDTGYAWYSVMHGSYSDWHTVTYLYILKIVQKLFGTPYPIVIFQGVLWIAVNQYALFLLEKYAPFKYADIFYLIVSFCLFGCYRAISNIEKDTLWNMCFFLFCLCIFDLVKTIRIRWYHFLLLSISASITATIRHMGNVIVIITFIFLLIFINYKKRAYTKIHFRLILFLLIFIMLARIFLLNIVGFGILHAAPNPSYVKYSIPMTMIGAVTVNEDLPEDDVVTLEQIMPLEKWQSCYNKYYADDISRDWGPIGEDIYKLNDASLRKTVLLMNLKFLFSYPTTYLTAYLDITSILWEMGTPADGYEWIPISLYSASIDPYPELSHLQTHYNAVTNALEKTSAFSDKIPIYSSICWRGGFALFTLILCFFLLIKKKHLYDLIVFLPILLLTGVLFLASPSQDPRYINSWQMLMNFLLIYSIFIFDAVTD